MENQINQLQDNHDLFNSPNFTSWINASSAINIRYKDEIYRIQNSYKEELKKEFINNFQSKQSDFEQMFQMQDIEKNQALPLSHQVIKQISEDKVFSHIEFNFEINLKADKESQIKELYAFAEDKVQDIENQYTLYKEHLKSIFTSKIDEENRLNDTQSITNEHNDMLIKLTNEYNEKIKSMEDVSR